MGVGPEEGLWIGFLTLVALALAHLLAAAFGKDD